MNPTATGSPLYNSFVELIDLANEKVGGQAIATNDDFFAEMGNLIKASAPVFIADKFTDRGKWMDGWESRRKRNLGPGNDHDWCIVQLGLPGVIRGVNVDTAFFTGNYPEYCSIEACEAPAGTAADKLTRWPEWKEILPKSRLQGGTGNLFGVASPARSTHLRLRIFPDGGVARLRVHGEVRPDWPKLGALPDLAAAVNGGSVVVAADSFFGPKDNLLLPGRAATMGDGWETRRKRGPGHDWIIIKLGRAGRLRKLEIDTNHFKGNYPDMASVEGLAHPARDLLACDFRDRKDIAWQPVLAPTKLQASHQHYFESELAGAARETELDYLRLNIFPDGGISRFRAHGVPGKVLAK